MKLAAIYNCWNDWDMLEYSLKNITPLVEGVIIVASEYSNHGERSPLPIWQDMYIREPKFKDPRLSETDKRNYGLDIAREQGYTHFLTMDADEFYEPEAFLKAKEHIKNSSLNGLVCPTQVYFKSPTLTVGFDGTYVPFIHRLTPDIKHEFNKSYPHAWTGNRIRIDPTRSLNISANVPYTENVICHHYSWIRKDFNVKIRNSTARKNLERSSILKDLLLAKEGYFVEFYQRHLQRSSVDFGIPDFSILC
jgi:hypothetical protein